MKDRLVALTWRVAPIVVSFTLAAIVFATSGFDVAEVVRGVIEGSISGDGAIAETLRWTIPLVLIGSGVAVSFKAGEFNIGGQGQFLMGQCAAVWVGLRWELPGPSRFVAAAVLATLVGAGWSAVAGVLKTRFGADEVITTLMLNFIAIQFVQWLTTGSLADPLTSGDAASTARLDTALRVQEPGGFSLELILLTAGICAAVWLVIERTALGMRITMVGSNPVAAQWQGLSADRARLSSYLLAGATAGAAGAAEVFGPAGRVVTGSTPTLGFTALVVATVASLSILGIIVVAVFFGALQAAVLFLPIVSDLPPSGLRIIEGLVALLITAQFATVARRRRSTSARARGPDELTEAVS